MAKRHKHFSGGRKSSSNGRGGSRSGKVNHKSKHLRKSGTKSVEQDNWQNSSIPMGGADLGADMDMKGNDYFNPGRAVISAKTIDDYYFGRKGKKQSMKMGGLRMGHRKESYDDRSSRNNSLRKRPVVFIKAKQSYDPSHDLILKLAEKNNGSKEIDITYSGDETSDSSLEDVDIDIDDSFDSDNNDIEHQDIYQSDSGSEGETEEMVTINSDEDDISSNNEEHMYSEEESGEEVEEVEEDSDDIVSKENASLFFVDEDGYDEATQPTIHSVKVEEPKPPRDKSKINVEFNPSLVIGKVELNLDEGEDSDGVVLVEPHPFHGYINNVMKNMQAGSGSEEEENEEDYNSETAYSSDQNILDHENGSDDQITSEIKSLDINTKSSERREVFEPEIKQIDVIKEDEENKDPEFGFLEEDYVIDTSEVIVSNIRLGMSDNSYYLKSYRLFGDHEFRWTNQSIFCDFLLEDLNLPEHRLDAYLKYVHDLLIPKEEPPEPTYPDIPISDSSDEEEENNNVNRVSGEEIMDDMREGLDALVNYAMKYNKDRNQEYETKTLETKGKGKKKKLLIDESLSLDTETIFSLQSKLSNRLDNKADKRRTKEDFISKENKNSSDLMKKYTFGLHIQNMKDEFEEFYANNRDKLAFPPIDPHGNKTVMKFAKHYNMKASKAGKGTHTHIVIDKTKKTKRNLPNYGLIGQLLKQRPIFMRIDVQRVKEEFIRTETIKIKSKFHVAEGEIVGENAPAIGKENIGRRMLEKLGWTNGEGLGPHGNQGISEPVFARVKKNKTGLRFTDDKE